jgi:hypothetical protein
MTLALWREAGLASRQRERFAICAPGRVAALKFLHGASKDPPLAIRATHSRCGDS